MNPTILSVIGPGTTILPISLNPLRALYKTTAAYCLFNLEIEFNKTGILYVNTQAFSRDPQNPKPDD